MTDDARKLEIRIAVRADVHSLGAFLVTVWEHAGPEALGFAGATDASVAELAEPDTLRGLLSDPDTTLLIASSGFVIVGFAAVRRLDDDTADLTGIVVGHDHRNHGVGGELVDAAFDIGRQIGAHRMLVRTEPHNDRAIAFYESHGFHRVGSVHQQVGAATLEVLELATDLSGARTAPDAGALRDADCIFCRIAHGEAPASLTYEDDDLIAFMDLYPLTPGHLLVVPREHRGSLADLPPDLGARMFTVAQGLAGALRASELRTEGINLFLADGNAAMQEIPHTHLHVIPRFADDGFRIHANRGIENPARAALDRQAAMVREAMSSP